MHGGFFMVLIVYITIIRVLIQSDHSIQIMNELYQFVWLYLFHQSDKYHANVMFMPWALETFPQGSEKAGPVTFELCL